jgi:hypothetical protein
MKVKVESHLPGAKENLTKLPIVKEHFIRQNGLATKDTNALQKYPEMCVSRRTTTRLGGRYCPT